MGLRHGTYVIVALAEVVCRTVAIKSSTRGIYVCAVGLDLKT